MSAMFIGIDAQKYPGVDKSPMDASFWRAERNSPPSARVLYSRPYAKGRTVWGGLIPYGKVWRTGANEAAEITFYKDVDFGGKAVKAGTYALFTLAEEGKVTAILNDQLHQWGAYGYNQDKDVARASAAVVEKTAQSVENFTILFDNQSDGSTHLVMAWDDMQARVAIK